LRWRGIEATLALAQSQNAKIVIIGGGKDGLPIILGNVDGAPAAGTAPAGNGPAGLLSIPGAAPSIGSSRLLSPSGTAPSQPVDNAPRGPTLKQTTGSASPSSADTQAKSSIPHDLTELEGLLSRVYDALRAPSTAANPSSAPQSKESATVPADRPK